MILRINAPGYSRFIECDGLVSREVQGGNIDIETGVRNGKSDHFLIGFSAQADGLTACLLDNGKVVETFLPGRADGAQSGA